MDKQLLYGLILVFLIFITVCVYAIYVSKIHEGFFNSDSDEYSSNDNPMTDDELALLMKYIDCLKDQDIPKNEITGLKIEDAINEYNNFIEKKSTRNNIVNEVFGALTSGTSYDHTKCNSKTITKLEKKIAKHNESQMTH